MQYSEIYNFLGRQAYKLEVANCNQTGLVKIKALQMTLFEGLLILMLLRGRGRNKLKMKTLFLATLSAE